MIFGNFVQL